MAQTAKRTAKKKTGTSKTKPAVVRKKTVSKEERHRMVSEAAYFKSLERPPDYQDSERDWYEAESEVNAILLGKTGRKS